MVEKNMLGGSGLVEVAGQLKDFAEKLGGKEGGRWLAAFKRFLRKEESWPKFPFLIWKTIKLGLRKSPEEYRNALKDGKYSIGDYANQILDKTSISQEEVEVDLVLVTGRELGFKESTRRDAIYDCALDHGLQKCPGEVGPALREQYPDQPNGEWILVAMEPIADSDGDPDVFDVERGASGLWLSSFWSDTAYVWAPDDRWVFVRPRK